RVTGETRLMETLSAAVGTCDLSAGTPTGPRQGPAGVRVDGPKRHRCDASTRDPPGARNPVQDLRSQTLCPSRDTTHPHPGGCTGVHGRCSRPTLVALSLRGVQRLFSTPLRHAGWGGKGGKGGR